MESKDNLVLEDGKIKKRGEYQVYQNGCPVTTVGELKRWLKDVDDDARIEISFPMDGEARDEPDLVISEAWAPLNRNRYIFELADNREPVRRSEYAREDHLADEADSMHTSGELGPYGIRK
jgi:hypothetical protein